MTTVSEIRAWLEDTADQWMRNANTTITIPPGVRELKWASDTDMNPVDVGQVNYTRAPGPSRITFIAELNNGDTIETTRG